MLCMTGCGKTRVIKETETVKLFPPAALTVLLDVPEIQGKTTGDLVDWALDLRRTAMECNGKINSLQNWFKFESEEK